MSKGFLHRAMGIVLALFMSSAAVFAQSALARLSGTILDETGAAVSDVAIVLLDADTNQRRQATTNADGAFDIPLLPPGHYVLSARREGFTPLDVPEVVLKANDHVALRLELKVDAIREAVVVTAQKTGSERLQDVPVPITAIDAQTLAINGQGQLRDFFSAVPGLSLSPDIVGKQTVAIRGITQGRASIPTVGSMVDDVPFNPSLGGNGVDMPDIDPGDLARIEVLRGPQGTLYGASSMGGLLRYATIEPALTGTSGQIELGTSAVSSGHQPGYKVRAALNTQPNRTAAIRVSGFVREEPGYVDNPLLALEDVNAVDAQGALVAALWHPTADTSMRLSGLYQRTHGDGLSDVDRLPGLGDLEQTFIPGVGPYDRTVQAHSLTFNAKLGRFALTSVTGYNRNNFSDAWDASEIYRPVAQREFGVAYSAFSDDAHGTKFAQEARVSGPLLKRVDLMAGAYYSHETYTIDQLITGTDAEGHVAGVLGKADDSRTAYREAAAFANATIHVNDRVDLQFGGRETRYLAENLGGLNTGPLWNGMTELITAESRANVFTYLVTPRVKLHPDVMAYARLASGYRPGTPNANANVLGIPASYKSDTTRNYEVGLKGTFLRHRLSLDTSVYYIDWNDIQIQASTALGIGYRTNGSGAKSEGVELSASVRPLAGLTIDGWISYDNAVLTEAFLPSSPVLGAPGDRLPFSSRHSGNLTIAQSVRFSDGWTATFGGAVSYVGDRISNFRGASPPRQYFPSYTKTDLRAGVKHGPWAIDAYVNNVGDVRGVLTASHYVLTRYTYIQPRSVGVSVIRAF